MKNAILVLSLLVVSCSRPGSALIGTWQTQDVELTISRDGENYIVDCKNPMGMVGGHYAGPYRDGQLQLQPPMFGNIVYSKERDTVYFVGHEFTRAKK